MAEDEDETVRRLTAYRREITNLVAEHRGRVADFSVDNFLAEFPTETDAVEAAVEIQRVIKARNAAVPAGRAMEFRIGVHLGEVRVEGERLYGDGVNIASRLEGLAEPGGVCVSEDVVRQVQRKLELNFDDLGRQKVKNIPDPVHAYLLRERTAKEPTSSTWLGGSGHLVNRLVVGGLAVIAFGALSWWAWNRPVTTTGPIRSIAVLPLENLSGDPEQEYFADGMTEALIGAVAKIRPLKVISRTSVMRYKDSNLPLPEIAQELGVDAVIEGTVMRAGDRVRITAQLIRASSDEHLWNDSYDRDLRDILTLHSEVARAIAREIELQLSSAGSPAQAERLVNPDAFEAFLRGRHHWNMRTGADLWKSIKYFENAIALDPDWALPHSGLAEAYALLAVYDQKVLPRMTMPRARAAAERALELVEELAPAHTALAGVRLWYEWDWAGAEAGFQRALELDPSYATAHHWYAILQGVLKQPGAIQHARRARELDPLSIVIGANVGIIQLFTRDYDGSIEALRTTLEFAPDFAFGQEWLIIAYVARGMHEEAVEVAERFTRTQPEPGHRVYLALAYAGAGRSDDAHRVLEEVRMAPIDPFGVAQVYATLGDAGSAFEWLEKAFERRSLRLSWASVDPLLDPLRSDPRFEDLLRRIGYPEG